MTDADEQTNGTSRRSFLKSAAGACAVGAGAVGAGATNRSATATQQSVEVLVSTFGFFPGRTFRVVSRLDAGTTVQLLRSPTGGTVPEISQPDDYNGYAVHYDFGTRRSVVTAFVFTRGTLRVDGQYRLTEAAQLFSPTLSLLRVTAVPIDGEPTERRTTTRHRTTGNWITTGNRTIGNRTTGNGIAGNRTGGNLTDGNRTTENGTGGDATDGDEATR